ncbi:MAG: heavy metal translocating P-type ATPase, partial [Verrucomicrobia bacterium]|nr:heavy metal translocating P-type ATPase [Verrucomicrobiota bacterium]
MESKHHSHDDHTECCHHHDKHDHCKCADHHHEHGPSCGCGHDHEHTLLPIQVTLAGVLFIVNSFVLDRFYGSDSMLSAMSALIGALIMGVPIVWTSIKDLFKGVLSINELVTLAVMAAFASGNYQTAGIVAFFMLLGEIIEMRTADGARKSIESLIKLAPTKARRLLKDGTEEEVPVSMLQIGDVVRVRPGDNVSADGVIVSGQGSFNQANITGESLPVDKKPGDEVFAGTQNLTGVLEIRVSRAGQDTTLGQVHNLILAAEKTRLPILRIIDQYMQYYTPMVLVIATLVWAFTFDLERVIAVLIVACPCAFILATPSAMVAALSAAARLGILIKNVSDIELAARINAFVFDKTGTLTQGKLIVNRLYPVEGVQPAELLQIAASAEKYSNHPTAKAINLLAKEAEIELSEPSDFSETAGRGVSAKVENMAVIIGRSQWLKDNGVSGDFLNSVDLNEAE